MADLSKTISIVIDTTVGNAKKGFSDLKQSVGEADGAFGKLKAGVSGATNVLGTLPLPAVAAGAAAAIGAVVGLGNQFEDAALSAKKLSDATGLTVEDASRWQEVAGDVGVSGEQISGAFEKAAKAIGMAPEKFEALGVSVQHAKDGTIDMNATFLNAIDTINKIEDPTQKAALASQLFGKSWAELTPVLSEGTDAIRENLAAVSDAKVITEGEVDAAKSWQASMDNLGDTLDDLKLSLGKLVVEGADPTLEALAGMAGQVDDLINAVDGGTGAVQDIAQAFSVWFKYLSPVGASIQALTLVTKELGAAIDVLEGPLKTLGAGISTVTGLFGDALGSVEDFVGGIGGAGVEIQKYQGFITDTNNDLGKHKDATADAMVQVSGFSDAVNGAGLLLDNLNGIVATATEKQQEHAAAVKQAKEEADAAKTVVEDYTQALLDEADATKNATLAQLDASSATIEATADLVTYQATLGNASLSADQHTLKLNAMETELINVSGKVGEAATANQTFASETDKAAASIQAQIGYLTQVRDTLAPDDPLRANLDAYIGQLNSVKANIATSVSLDTADALAKLNTFIGRLQQAKTIWQLITTGSGNLPGNAGGTQSLQPRPYANGGDVMTLVGERGPEPALLPTGTNITPNERARNWIQTAAREAVGPVAVAPAVYNQTFTFLSTVNDREVARLQRRYERRNGSVTIA